MFDAAEWARRVAGEGCAACAMQAEAERLRPSPQPLPEREGGPEAAGADKLVETADADSLWLATLPSGRVRLQDDGDFPGYCILYYRRHVTEPYELSAAERQELMDDLARLARAIADVCRPAKINYACLGNLLPHLHWHIVPRYPEDGWWGRPFTDRPAERKRVLGAEEYGRVRVALRGAMASGGFRSSGRHRP